MTFVDLLPHLNATFNGLAAVSLVCGFVAVKRGKIALHKRCMVGAFCFSTLFLTFYLTRQFLAGHTEFGGEGTLRAVYLGILISHMILAVPVVPLATTLLILGVRGRIDAHRRLARVTLPVWLYVSVTGVVVYVLLFQLYPKAVAG